MEQSEIEAQAKAYADKACENWEYQYGFLPYGFHGFIVRVYLAGAASMVQ